MCTKLSVGVSEARNEKKAAGEAVEQALAEAKSPAFALVLSTDQYDDEALASELAEALKDVPWAGCCTAGVFGDDGVLLRQGLVVGIVSSEDARVGIGVGGPVSKDGRMAGVDSVCQALEALGPADSDRHRALILLPDALTGNAADVVRGAGFVAGSGIAWAGGGAGDNLRFSGTAQYANGEAFVDRVISVALELPRPIGGGIRHGWRPYGPPTLVTRADGATALELEYENAFDVYRRTVAGLGNEVTLDSFAKFAMTHPLGIPQANGEHIIRDPLEVDSSGGLRCVAEVPDGSLVRIMEGDKEALLLSAKDAVAEAREAAGGDLGGAIIFDCVSRALMLGDDVHMETRAFREGLGEKTPMMGCLIFGEVGALGTGVPQFHNKTTVLLALPA